MPVPGPSGQDARTAASPPRPLRLHHQDAGQASRLVMLPRRKAGATELGWAGGDEGRRLWETPGVAWGHGHVADGLSGAPWRPPRGLCRPERARAGLARDLRPHAVCLGREVSMQLPSPTRRHRRPPAHRTHLRPTPRGRDPRCTHCKKCTFQGRGCGAEWEDPEVLEKGGHPASPSAEPRRGGPSRLPGGGGR